MTDAVREYRNIDSSPDSHALSPLVQIDVLRAPPEHRSLFECCVRYSDSACNGIPLPVVRSIKFRMQRGNQKGASLCPTVKRFERGKMSRNTDGGSLSSRTPFCLCCDRRCGKVLRHTPPQSTNQEHHLCVFQTLELKMWLSYPIL